MRILACLLPDGRSDFRNLMGTSFHGAYNRMRLHVLVECDSSMLVRSA